MEGHVEQEPHDSAAAGGLEALRICAPDDYKRIMENAERQAADTYRRIYARAHRGTQQTLDSAMWIAFKKAGGEASW